MTNADGSRRVVLRGANARPAWWRLARSLWVAAALAVYAAVVLIGWPLIERRAFELNQAAGDHTTPALVQAGLAFALFGLVASVALTLCWRRKGFMRVMVLIWPLVMLATPEVARLLPGPWIWLGCLVLGIVGAVFIAGPDQASRREFFRSR